MTIFSDPSYLWCRFADCGEVGHLHSSQNIDMHMFSLPVVTIRVWKKPDGLSNVLSCSELLNFKPLVIPSARRQHLTPSSLEQWVPLYCIPTAAAPATTKTVQQIPSPHVLMPYCAMPLERYLDEGDTVVTSSTQQTEHEQPMPIFLTRQHLLASSLVARQNCWSLKFVTW